MLALAKSAFALSAKFFTSASSYANANMQQQQGVQDPYMGSPPTWVSPRADYRVSLDYMKHCTPSYIRGLQL